MENPAQFDLTEAFVALWTAGEILDLANGRISEH